jgi:glucosamine--fructose-6-phosphate aminotransferase (isomerizing)
MCGVIGLVYEQDRPDLGQVAATLLETLEYRGYDSTGAAIQPGDGDVALRKGVGKPSVVCAPLGITALSGRVFCGQVRWATFGAVDAINAQPHVMAAPVHLYGAHNGNVTNCDDLKQTLLAAGHDVKSDNDGEMVLHTIGAEFARQLDALPESERDVEASRRSAMRAAIRAASSRLIGSFSSVVVDPETRVVWAIKAGSSLYAGVGEDREGGRFVIASSDLSSVLKLTHRLVPLSRGEFIEYDAKTWQVYGVADAEPRARAATRSRLMAQDIELRPPYETFMEQEIADQVRACDQVVRLFHGGSDRLHILRPHLEAAEFAPIDAAVHAFRGQSTDAGARASLQDLLAVPAFLALLESAPTPEDDAFHSSERALLTTLADEADTRSLGLLDAWIEHDEVREFDDAVERFAQTCSAAQDGGGRIYAVCCGTSYHAAKAAALFFNELAGVQLLPVLPGEFRGQYDGSLRDGDVVVAVTQSGETKDVVDVLNRVIHSGRTVARLALVNNINSSIAQELSDIVVPLHCGPEIAVPATKSFINQLAVFFGLALRLAERHVGPSAALDRRRAGFAALPDLVARTLEETGPAVEDASEHLYLEPSMHILATRISAIAKEGALKIREVVLNHTEGFEGAEFKHGPNTILGFNTLMGPLDLQRLLTAMGDIPARSLFDGRHPDHARAVEALSTLRTDYPLIYVTGPEPVDVALTISQINTHKIRGAKTIVIAEEHPGLRQAAEKPPAGASGYEHDYIALPATGDHLMTVFSATVVLQRLALRMSERKAAWLDARDIADHGVHPDVPKNVSKSITVD